MKIYGYTQFFYCFQNNKELPIIVKEKPPYKNKLLSWFTDYVLLLGKKEEFFLDYYETNDKSNIIIKDAANCFLFRFLYIILFITSSYYEEQEIKEYYLFRKLCKEKK